MIKQIVAAFINLGKWIRHWLWEVPVAKPIPEKPIRVMGEQVFNDYTVIVYDKQRINLSSAELKLWNDNKKVYPRKDKRATARKFKEQEKKGIIRFEEINGKLICLKNKNYGVEKNL